MLGYSLTSAAGGREPLNSPETVVDRFSESADDAGDQLQNLNGVSQEERMRLRLDLHHFSRTSDPIHTQIEDRRRVMSKGIQERFFGADRDNDGLLSRQEVVDSLPQVARHFGQVDLDSDGFISISELVGYQAKILERQRASELRLQQAREAEMKAVESATETELANKQTKRPKVKSKQAEIDRKPAL